MTTELGVRSLRGSTRAPGGWGIVRFRIYKLGELGEVSFGMLNLGELGEVSFGI